jgi:signal peptidase I
MDPTIPDGSLQVIYQTNEDVSEGQIIVFQSQQAGGNLIIHRVQSREPGGLITIGDNNQRTDQRTGEPLVQKEQIRGVAVTIQDQPIYIPYVGSLVQFGQTNTIEVLLILLGFMGTYGLYQEMIASKKQQGILTQNDIVFPIFAGVFVVLTVVILLGATTVAVPMTYTSADSAAQQQYVVSIDDPNPEEVITIDVKDKLGTEVYSSSYNIIDTNTDSDSARLTVSLPPRDEPGGISGYVRIYRFPPILPESWLQALITISPLIPAVLSSASVLVPLYGLYLIFGTPYERVAKPRNRLIKKIYERL